MNLDIVYCVRGPGCDVGVLFKMSEGCFHIEAVHPEKGFHLKASKQGLPEALNCLEYLKQGGHKFPDKVTYRLRDELVALVEEEQGM